MASKTELEESLSNSCAENRRLREILRDKQQVVDALLEFEPAYRVFIRERWTGDDDYSELVTFAKLKREDRALAEYEARLASAKAEGV